MAHFFDTLNGKRVAFIGAGVSHKQLITMFAKAGAQVTLCDARTEKDFKDGYIGEVKKLGVNTFLGESYMDGFAGQDMIMRTPGFEFFTPQLQAAVKNGVHVTSEMELFFEYCPCRVIGITGSDGKTTTTSLIAAMLEESGKTVHLGGNIGRPLLPIVDEIDREDIAVVELSSFQLISMHTSPAIALVTNVTPNHLDHHKDMDEYVNAKLNILAWQEKDGLAVLNMENPITRGMQKDVNGKLRWFSLTRKVDDGAFMDEDGWLCVAKRGEVHRVVNKTEVYLRGTHNLDNLLAAMAVVYGIAPKTAMAQVAKTFTGVQHRIEPVRNVNGVQWYNDSIATSPTRAIAGLKSFDQKLILIAGGYDKNLDYTPFAPEVLAHVKKLILTGQTANKIEAAVRANPGFDESGIEIYREKDLEKAVKTAHKQAQGGDVVILSPASASFDAYPNFEERGKHFKKLVNSL